MRALVRHNISRKRHLRLLRVIPLILPVLGDSSLEYLILGVLVIAFSFAQIPIMPVSYLPNTFTSVSLMFGVDIYGYIPPFMMILTMRVRTWSCVNFQDLQLQTALTIGPGEK